MFDIGIENCFICEQNFIRSDVDRIENECPELFKMHETSGTRVMANGNGQREQFLKRITEIRNERRQQCAIFGDGERVSICKKHLQEIVEDMA